MMLCERLNAADALIERLQALGLAPGAQVLLYTETLPEWAWDQLAIMAACCVISICEVKCEGRMALSLSVDAAGIGIFATPEVIKGASDGA